MPSKKSKKKASRINDRGYATSSVIRSSKLHEDLDDASAIVDEEAGERHQPPKESIIDKRTRVYRYPKMVSIS